MNWHFHHWTRGCCSWQSKMERLIERGVPVSKCVCLFFFFLVLQAAQVKCHLAPLYWGEGRHLYTLRSRWKICIFTRNCPFNWLTETPDKHWNSFVMFLVSVNSEFALLLFLFCFAPALRKELRFKVSFLKTAVNCVWELAWVIKVNQICILVGRKIKKVISQTLQHHSVMFSLVSLAVYVYVFSRLVTC